MEGSKTVDQALRLLFELHRRGEQTPVELARALDCNRTVAHRLLASLQNAGFVQRDNDRARYAIGPALAQLAAPATTSLRDLVRPVTDQLSAKTGETVLFCLREGSRAVVAEQSVGVRHPVRVQWEVGRTLGLEQGASGRAVLLGSPQSFVRAVAAMTSDPATLIRQVAQARERGYAVSRDEAMPEVGGIAVPIAGADRRATGSLMLAVPVSRGAALTSHLPELRAAAALIEEALAERRPA
ncbi:IclR family transcriptional regulator [Nocardia sp. alder85J]|uniref:IclR family transcriptional regulator n=1 Tax=Nocardia sp. alder85J TaxID=2862949 RepID=UPI001CD762D7|nr:IclR family transcriptional regulator C-terminal domain-containing protein [Nocardia sp. alder85J]MCX4091838.1 helix-turn-helix domain-containing protein [Nocardia sp. alder85J]